MYKIEVITDLGFAKIVKIKTDKVEFETLIDEENENKIEEIIKEMEAVKDALN